MSLCARFIAYAQVFVPMRNKFGGWQMKGYNETSSGVFERIHAPTRTVTNEVVSGIARGITMGKEKEMIEALKESRKLIYDYWLSVCGDDEENPHATKAARALDLIDKALKPRAQKRTQNKRPAKCESS